MRWGDFAYPAWRKRDSQSLENWSGISGLRKGSKPHTSSMQATWKRELQAGKFLKKNPCVPEKPQPPCRGSESVELKVYGMFPAHRELQYIVLTGPFPAEKSWGCEVESHLEQQYWKLNCVWLHHKYEILILKKISKQWCFLEQENEKWTVMWKRKYKHRNHCVSACPTCEQRVASSWK